MDKVWCHTCMDDPDMCVCIEDDTYVLPNFSDFMCVTCEDDPMQCVCDVDVWDNDDLVECV